MDREEIFEYVKKQYGTIPEYLWSSSPDSAVLRHHNGKWYAVIMNVERSKLGLDGDDTVEIIDVKCDPEMTGMIIQTYGFLPGYHMNKQHWITILLDGTVGEKKKSRRKADTFSRAYETAALNTSRPPFLFASTTPAPCSGMAALGGSRHEAHTLSTKSDGH